MPSSLSEMAAALSPGAIFANFRVESLAGRGAMAEVYRAYDEGHGRSVALKLLGSLDGSDERFRQRFLRESQLAASLDHPHIVKTFSAGEDDGRLFIAMEYIEGDDLRQLLRHEGRLDPERAVELIGQAAGALDAAHAAGLVHRDVKPGNILVGADADGEHVYVCDFGLARHVSSVSSLTGDRGFVGTIDYVSPEQIEGSPVDARSDVYSLCCVLYECLAGARPYDRDSELSVVFAHLNEPPPRLTDVRPELPAAFDDVFATALAKAPDDRYASCGELAAAARAALRGEVLVRRRSRRRLTLAIVGVAVVAAAATTAVVLTQSGGSPPLVTITPSSIAGARLGISSVDLQRVWGSPGQRLSMQFPPNYSLVTERSRNVSAYFVGTTDSAVEITTWNKADRTAEGIGPCSSFAALKKAYGSRLKASKSSTHNGVSVGYTVGKHLFFALGPGTTPKIVEAVALFSNPSSEAGYNALNDGPCAAGTAPIVVAPAAKAAGSSTTPSLTQTAASHTFAPRLTIAVPAGWHVRTDEANQFVIAAAGGAAIDFRLDPRPTSASGKPLLDLSRTPLGLLTWLQHNKELDVSTPETTLLGHPTLTAHSFEVSSKRSSGAVAYFSFGGQLAKAQRRPVHLYLTAIRIDALAHTLAIAVTVPSKSELATVDAILTRTNVAAAAVPELSALSSYCTQVFYGTCKGELARGTHKTTTFAPALAYTVPAGWINFTDHPGVFGLVPPGGDWSAVDQGHSDYIDVETSIATAREGCADGHSTIHTPTAFADWLAHEPGLTTTRPAGATVGGLSGVVVDIRMRKGWTQTCRWSQGVPAAQVISGLRPSPTGLMHGMLPQPMTMRLYLLGYRHGTLGIEIDEVKGAEKLDAYSAVVKTFHFKAR